MIKPVIHHEDIKLLIYSNRTHKEAAIIARKKYKETLGKSSWHFYEPASIAYIISTILRHGCVVTKAAAQNSFLLTYGRALDTTREDEAMGITETHDLSPGFQSSPLWIILLLWQLSAA